MAVEHERVRTEQAEENARRDAVIMTQRSEFAIATEWQRVRNAEQETDWLRMLGKTATQGESALAAFCPLPGKSHPPRMKGGVLPVQQSAQEVLRASEIGIIQDATFRFSSKTK